MLHHHFLRTCICCHPLAILSVSVIDGGAAASYSGSTANSPVYSSEKFLPWHRLPVSALENDVVQQQFERVRCTGGESVKSAKCLSQTPPASCFICAWERSQRLAKSSRADVGPVAVGSPLGWQQAGVPTKEQVGHNARPAGSGVVSGTNGALARIWVRATLLAPATLPCKKPHWNTLHNSQQYGFILFIIKSRTFSGNNA